ncbi:MAG: DNA polymerase III subunit beta [Puniceicoccales bacterium]|jgi:DNA polymerase-3 subunit beta|nr:DNA polymerase III subunit beta [Puniceicoccales bacterium]
MKFSVERDALCDALQAIGGAVAANPTAPILSNVLLEAGEGGLALTATNLDFAMGNTLAAAVEKEGSATLPLRKMASVCRAIDADSIDVELLSAGTAVRLAGGGSLFRLTALPAGDFPSLPIVEKSVAVELPAAKFTSLLRQVDYAQSRDEHRQILNGIYFQLAEGTLTLVATDGRRLARSCHRGAESGSGTLILPARSGAELLRLLAEADKVAFSFGNRQVFFEVAYPEDFARRRAFLVSKVVEGTYPNYRQVIPSVAEWRVALLREAFLSALQRAALVVSGAAPAVRLKFSENLVEIFASSGDVGDAYERVAAVSPGQREAEISFNPKYLIDPLRALNCPEVFFEFRDHLSPGVLRADEDFLCVVMPLRAVA